MSEMGCSFIKTSLVVSVQGVQAAQVAVIDLTVFRQHSALQMGEAGDLQLQRTYQARRDLILNLQSVIGLAVVRLRPAVRAIASVDELRSHAHMVASAAHAAFD